MRLQKYLSQNGVASRRKCEEYILQGKVKVNNKVVKELGFKVDSDKDIIEFQNKLIKNNKEKHTYILLNKPIGYVTTVKDQFNRPTVLDLIKDINKRLVPVGRLDMFTSGALILTDDGDFVYKITHPKFEIEKTYITTIKGQITNEELQTIENGMKIDNYITNKAKAKIIKHDEEKNITRVVVTIHEGKNREVRKMFETLGKSVLALHRSKIGDIEVKDLKIGTWRKLSNKEIESLIKLDKKDNM